MELIWSQFQHQLGSQRDVNMCSRLSMSNVEGAPADPNHWASNHSKVSNEGQEWVESDWPTHLQATTNWSLHPGPKILISFGLLQVMKIVKRSKASHEHDGDTCRRRRRSSPFALIKTVYTIPDDTEFRATSIAWKLPYFELKKYITKIRLPSENGIKIQV